MIVINNLPLFIFHILAGTGLVTVALIEIICAIEKKDSKEVWKEWIEKFFYSLYKILSKLVNYIKRKEVKNDKPPK